MAVERSYARLGLFVVLTLIVVIATATAVRPAAEEPRR